MTKTIRINGIETTPEEFWRSLSNSDACALAKVAPPIAPPWVKGELWMRVRGDIGWFADVFSDGVWVARGPGPYGMTRGKCDTVESAKLAADKCLTELGYILEDSEASC